MEGPFRIGFVPRIVWTLPSRPLPRSRVLLEELEMVGGSRPLDVLKFGVQYRLVETASRGNQQPIPFGPGRHDRDAGFAGMFGRLVSADGDSGHHCQQALFRDELADGFESPPLPEPNRIGGDRSPVESQNPCSLAAESSRGYHTIRAGCLVAKHRRRATQVSRKSFRA